MKDALYFTLVRRYGSYDIMRVTSEKGNNHRAQAFGSIDGSATHASLRDCTGRFESELEANDRVDAVRRIRKTYADFRAPYDQKLAELRSQEENDIAALLRGE